MIPDEFEVSKIPDVFHSSKQKKPFCKCLVCETDLSVDGMPYLIEKSFEKGELLFELAICLSCIEKMHSEFSKESSETIENFFNKRMNIHIRRESILEHHGHDMDHWLGKCVITGKAIDEHAPPGVHA